MKKISLFLILFLLCLSTTQAAFTVRNGRIVDADDVPTMSLKDHFNAGMEAVEKCDWYEVVANFRVVAKNAPRTPIGQEAHYWLGIGYFYLEEYDFANDAYSEYLKGGSNPAYFQDAVEYKYQIAEKFRCGAKRRPFGTKHLPKWASAYDMALDIYDEVIAAMPSSDIAARAYFSKGWLLLELRDYRGSIEAFQTLIKRFPKNELAPDSYLMITHVYLDQCQREFQNPDLLAFAELTVRKFAQDFPREERLEQAEYNFACIKELYAKGLFDTGRFYERTSQPHASIIYYQKAITQFPDTLVADRCKQRLEKLNPQLLENQTAAVEVTQPKQS